MTLHRTRRPNDVRLERIRRKKRKKKKHGDGAVMVGCSLGKEAFHVLLGHS